MIENLMTVRNYAKRKKVTTQCVYYWIKNGIVKVVEIDGIKFIQK